MTLRPLVLGAAVLVGLSASGQGAQAPAPPAQGEPGQAAPASPTFRVKIDLVTTDVIVRDRRGPVRRGPDEGRFRGSRGRRQAGAVLVRRSSTAAASTTTAGRRRRRRRRKASSCRRRARATTPPAASSASSSTTCTSSSANTGRIRILFKKICQGADSRRRHVRHRLDGHLVDCHRPDLRPEATRRGRQEDHGGRAASPSEIIEQGQRVPRGPSEVLLSRARRVLDGLRSAEEPRAGAQPAEGA